MHKGENMKKRLLYLILSFIMLFSSVPVMAQESCIHDWDDWYEEIPATCVDTGEEIRYCYNCGESQTRIIPATGKHDWDDWYTTKSATISRTGLKERECLDCGKSQKKEIKKLTPYAKLSKKTVKLQASKSTTLKISYAKGDSVKKWKSSNNKVATVSKKGKVKAKKKGTAKITVTLKSGKKATCTIKVSAKKKAKKSGTVYWVANGKVYHSTKKCPTLSRSRKIYSGSKSKCPKKRACKVCY